VITELKALSPTPKYNVLLELGVSTTILYRTIKFLALSITSAKTKLNRYNAIFGLINCIVIITNAISLKVCTKQLVCSHRNILHNCLLTSKYTEDIGNQDATLNCTGSLVKCYSPSEVLPCSARWFWWWTQPLPQADSPRTGPRPRTRPNPDPACNTMSYDCFQCGKFQSSMCSYMLKWEIMF